MVILEEIRQIQDSFKVNEQLLTQELHYFNYLESKFYLMMFGVFKACLKQNLDIFKFIKQRKLIILISKSDLLVTNFKKTWFQLQKLKTKYPFINIMLELDTEVMQSSPNDSESDSSRQSSPIFRLFKAENIFGVFVNCLKWERKQLGEIECKSKVQRRLPFSSAEQAKKGKWKLHDKSFLSILVDLIEQDYHIMLQVDNIEQEIEKFKYLDVLRKNVVNK